MKNIAFLGAGTKQQEKEASSEKARGQDREHHVGEEETNKDHHGNSNSTSG